MKLQLKKKKIKTLSLNDKQISENATPQVAGGNGWSVYYTCDGGNYCNAYSAGKPCRYTDVC